LFLILDIFVNIFNYGRRKITILDQSLRRLPLNFFWDKWSSNLIFHCSYGTILLYYRQLLRDMHMFKFLLGSKKWLPFLIDISVRINFKVFLQAINELLSMAPDLCTRPSPNISLNPDPILSKKMHSYKY
jgi:hypothetical protein